MEFASVKIFQRLLLLAIAVHVVVNQILF